MQGGPVKMQGGYPLVQGMMGEEYLRILTTAKQGAELVERRARLQPCRQSLNRWKAVPQGLKPSSIFAQCGTAEAVPFV
jgi:hypothetical protein